MYGEKFQSKRMVAGACLVSGGQAPPAQKISQTRLGTDRPPTECVAENAPPCRRGNAAAVRTRGSKNLVRVILVNFTLGKFL